MTALEEPPPGLVDLRGTVPGSAVADIERLRLLGETAARLAGALPALPRRMTLRAGDCAVELELGEPPAPVATVSGPDARAWPPPGTAVVRAPLVGTLFVAPAPGADPFVAVGDQVTRGQQLAIVEAMKLMNPVSADVAGTVLEVLADDGASVEYDQPLLLLAVDDAL
jgi:acetyl-CoA carboxylase biotin carboxyl carrier protein